MCCHFSGDKMKNPGNWILGTPKDEDRDRGMGTSWSMPMQEANRSGTTQGNLTGITFFLLTRSRPPA
jgi:hypothetical protein